jgi:hypothetical protein
MATIFISGYYTGAVPFHYEIRPNSVDKSIENIGEDIRALDGTNHRYHRNYKRKWALTFTNVHSGIANTLERVFTTPDEFVFQDIEGNTYTVFTEANTFTRKLSATTVSLQGVRLYTVTLDLSEV